MQSQIIFLLALNAPAVYAGKRTSSLDESGEASLNRMFPGIQNRSPTQMICWWVVNHLPPKVNTVFDLNSAGKSIDHSPSVKIRPWTRDFAYNDMKRRLREMGILPVDMELPEPEHKVALEAPWTEPENLYFNKGGVVFCKRTPVLCEVGDALFFNLQHYEG